MKFNLEFADLHTTIFIAHGNGGTNFGPKLYFDKRNKKMFEQFYLEERQGYPDRIVILFEGKTCYVPSWQNVILLNDDMKKEDSKPQVVSHPIMAQVSTPHSNPPKTVRRPAKYQGEETQGE